MLNSKSYIHIWWWMLNELGLKGSELIIYATIFSFTNWTDDHCFHGSAEYLSNRAGISRQNVIKNLRKLEKKWLICRKEREMNWVKFVDYYTTGCPKMRQPLSQNETSYNSVNNSISNSIELDNIHNPQEEKFEIQLSDNTVAWLTKSPAELSPVLLSFVKDSFQKFKGIEYQWEKQWEKFFRGMVDDYNYLCKEYGEDLVQMVLQFVKQDEFRSKQIQSIWKLRKKNKDWVPYMVVMLEKIQNYKPKVIDLDQYK